VIPIITYPLAALAFVALPTVLAIYALHHRYRRLPVSSLMLWQQLRKAAPGGIVVQRMVFPLLLFLEILALLLIALAALDMRWVVQERGRPLMAVVDNSSSMLAALPDGGSALRKAHSELRNLISRHRFAPVEIILAGQRPAAAPPADIARFLAGGALPGWDGLDSGAGIEDALAQAIRQDRRGAALLVVSDHLPATAEATPSGQIRWLAVGEPVPNVGFIDALRSDRGGTATCAIEIGNFGFAQVEVPVAVTTGGRRETVRVTLAPGKSRRLVMTLDDPAADFQAALPDDGLAVDNQILLVAPGRRPVAVAVEIADAETRRLVTRAVEATGLAHLGSPPELRISDRAAAAGEPGCWRLQVIRPADAQGIAGPFFADSAHPLLEGVDLRNLVWGAQPGMSLPGQSILSSAETDLLTESAAGGLPVFHLQIDPAVSTVQLAPAWPALFHNLLTLRKNALPGFRQNNIRAGMSMECQLPPTAKQVEILAPGRKQAVRLPVAGRQFSLPARVPGLYRLDIDGDTHRVACNFLAPAESDTRRHESGVAGEWGDLERRRDQLRASAPLLLMAALAVLALHQYVIRRSVG
jgi:hypothetical protein